MFAYARVHVERGGNSRLAGFETGELLASYRGPDSRLGQLRKTRSTPRQLSAQTKANSESDANESETRVIKPSTIIFLEYSIFPEVALEAFRATRRPRIEAVLTGRAQQTTTRLQEEVPLKLHEDRATEVGSHRG